MSCTTYRWSSWAGSTDQLVARSHVSLTSSAKAKPTSVREVKAHNIGQVRERHGVVCGTAREVLSCAARVCCSLSPSAGWWFA